MYLDLGLELFIDHEIDPILVVACKSDDFLQACHILAYKNADSILYTVQKHSSW